MNFQITSLKQLINKLKNATKEEYKDIGVTLDLPISEMLPYAHWSNEYYTRNCIIRESDFELILLCWEPGQDTDVHCHGGEECWVYIIDGQIEETHYQFENNELQQESHDKLVSGQKSFMSDDIGYHKLKNNTTKRAMSLHLYMDPIDTCTYYDEDKNQFTPIALSYYSYQGILEKVEV